ncbi:tetratricopeptide repeat-containing glycosyltransferase family 2 protein [Ferviditalea candida]|uniref:Glycosyltransferase n=1 Tax=Ferviditalea candida TaxID=3108399 RepID=A0ABU5ZJG3_9BACL|nr:glycosyltransferase [Paenibacillaceae bacterium T2]
MKKLLSLCMIVKNEEKVLGRCLKSVKTLVDEIIIVDTGSTDSTKEIAKSFTEHVYDFEWVNDFSAARNYSIQQATGKWILVLDADEYVSEEDFQALRDYLIKANPTVPVVYLLPIINYTGESERLVSGIIESTGARLFPNHPDINYSSPIHEQLRYLHGELKYDSFPLRIYHTGYLSDVSIRQNKAERNMNIFSEKLVGQKKLNAYENFTLAREYINAKNYKKALYYLQKAYDRAKPDNIWLPFCIDDLISTYLQLGRLTDAFALIQKQLSLYPQYVDYYCLSGLFFHHFGFYDKAQELLETCVRLAEEAERSKRSFALVKPDYGYRIPYQILYQIARTDDDLEKMVFYLTKLLQINPNQIQFLFELCELLQIHEPAEKIVSFLQKLYPLSNPGNRLFLLQTSILLGNPTLADTYYEACLESGIPLSHNIKLKYYFLKHDRKSFDETIPRFSTGEQHAEHTSSQLLNTAIAWNEPAYLAHIHEVDPDLLNKLHLAQDFFVKDEIQVETEDEIGHATAIAIDLFRSGYFEAYDRFVAKIKNWDVMNRLADYFSAHGYKDIAFDYYSMLFEKGALQANGLEFIGRHFINQGEYQDGLLLLQQAIDQHSASIPLFTLYLQTCRDKDNKFAVKEKLFEIYPSCRNLSILSSL